MLASVIKFSPTPEYQDAIGVGLLIHDSPPRIVWDSKFSKLSCIAPELNTDMLQTWFGGLNQMLSDVPPSEAMSTLKRLSGQLSFGPQFPISGTDQDAAIDRLLTLVASKPKLRYSSGEVLGGSRLEHVIDESLANLGAAQATIRRRPLLKDLFPKHLMGKVGTPNTRVSRVIDSRNELILIDGVDLRFGSRQESQRRAEKIGFTYYAVSRVKQELEIDEQRTLTRVSMLYAPESAKITVQEDYARHVFDKESDLLIDSRNRNPSAEAYFRALLARADEPRLALH